MGVCADFAVLVCIPLKCQYSNYRKTILVLLCLYFRVMYSLRHIINCSQ